MDRAGRFLTLASLVSVLLCSIAVAMSEQLLAAVLTARATQKAARGVSGAPGEDLRTARRACLHALDEYTQALKSHCFPVPYQLHMELLLLRGLCGLSSDSRNGASPTGGDIDRALQVIIKEAVATRSPSNRSRS